MLVLRWCAACSAAASFGWHRIALVWQTSLIVEAQDVLNVITDLILFERLHQLAIGLQQTQVGADTRQRRANEREDS